MEHYVRINGNASEYIPLFIGVIIFLSLSPVNWVIYSVVILATVSRVLHAIGMYSIENTGQRHPFRFIGAVGTYVSMFAFGCIILMKAF